MTQQKFSNTMKKFEINATILAEIERSRQLFDEHLGGYLLANLKALGFAFETDADVLAFCETRVSKVETEPHEYELFVDYGQPNQKLVGIYSAKIAVTHDGETVNITYG